MMPLAFANMSLRCVCRWNGFVEAGDVSDFNFEDQRRTYDTLGYALDPSVAGATSIAAFVGDREKAKQCVSPLLRLSVYGVLAK